MTQYGDIFNRNFSFDLFAQARVPRKNLSSPTQRDYDRTLGNLIFSSRLLTDIHQSPIRVSVQPNLTILNWRSSQLMAKPKQTSSTGQRFTT